MSNCTGSKPTTPPDDVWVHRGDWSQFPKYRGSMSYGGFEGCDCVACRAARDVVSRLRPVSTDGAFVVPYFWLGRDAEAVS